MPIPLLNPVSPWPTRKGSQERFDSSVKESMDQISTMVGDLNLAIPEMNVFFDLLNQQLPYIDTVADADAAIRAVYTAIAQVNTVSAGIESVNACATWMEKIKLVAENMAEVVSAQGYAEEAKKWALMAEAVVNVKPATKEALGLVIVGDGLDVDNRGVVSANAGEGLVIDASSKKIKVTNPISAVPAADTIPVSGSDGKLDPAWLPLTSSVYSKLITPAQITLNTTFSMEAIAGSDSLEAEPVSASLVLSSAQAFSTEEHTDIFEEAITLTGQYNIVFDKEFTKPSYTTAYISMPVFNESNDTVVMCSPVVGAETNEIDLIVSRNKGKTWGEEIALHNIGTFNLLKTDSKGTWIVISKSLNLTYDYAISHDDAKTWTLKKFNETPESSILCLETDTNGTWVATFSKTNILISNDNGESWTLQNTTTNNIIQFVTYDKKGLWYFCSSYLDPFVRFWTSNDLSIFSSMSATFTSVGLSSVYDFKYIGNGNLLIDILSASAAYIFVYSSKENNWSNMGSFYTNSTAISNTDIDGNIFLSGGNANGVARLNTKHTANAAQIISNIFIGKVVYIQTDGKKTWLINSGGTLQRMILQQYFNSKIMCKITSAMTGQIFKATFMCTDSEGVVHTKETSFAIV